MINFKKYFLYYILNYIIMENLSLNFDFKKIKFNYGI